MILQPVVCQAPECRCHTLAQWDNSLEKEHCLCIYVGQQIHRPQNIPELGLLKKASSNTWIFLRMANYLVFLKVKQKAKEGSQKEENTYEKSPTWNY